MTIIYYEEDRNHGPFIIRVSGSREFVSRVDTRRTCTIFDGILVYSEDPNEALQFDDLDEAIEVAKEVFEQDDMHLSIEIAGGFCD
tara:strand:+ start:284 stop:541 length:258 start_codon:yes stop_codon:yes gene_type:complete